MTEANDQVRVQCRESGPRRCLEVTARLEDGRAVYTLRDWVRDCTPWMTRAIAGVCRPFEARDAEAARDRTPSRGQRGI